MVRLPILDENDRLPDRMVPVRLTAESLAATYGGGGGGGGAPLTDYSAQVASLPDYPDTFPPDLTGVDKSDIGLGNVDNTSDANKPVSSATTAALNGKLTFVSVGISGSGRLLLATTPTPAGMIAGDIVVVVPA